MALPPLVCSSSSSSASIPASPLGPIALPAPAPVPKPEFLPGPVNYQNLVDIGTAKATASPSKLFFLGIMGGAYIALGSLLMTSVGGNMPGVLASNPGLWRLLYALTFPYGLMMVIFAGAELFTGNTAIVTMALFEGKIGFGQLMKNFFFSYTGNFVGSLLVVALMVASGSMVGNSMLINAAINKTALPFGTALVRGILANWLVCIAVIQAASSSTLIGKAVAIWLPITAFVALGLEHSVANMFLIPAGILLGAPVTISDFLIKNLLPVTLGNVIAGVVFLALISSIVYGSLGKKMGV